MERCPPEIWQEICALACVDGGYTGCSLSLASKFMHNASRAACYHSVSLIGHRPMLAFAKLVEKKPAARAVQRLFFSDSKADLGGWQTWDADGRRPSVLRTLWGKAAKLTNRGTSFSKFVAGSDRQTAEVMELAERILAAVGPTLRSLVFFALSNAQVTLLPIELPVLEELTCFHSHRHFPTHLEDDGCPPMPALRRVDLVSGLHSFPWINFARITPCLVFLRISELKPARELPGHAAVFLGHRKSTLMGKLPSSVERVELHIPRWTDHSCYGCMERYEDEVMEQLRAVADADPRRRLVLTDTPIHFGRRLDTALEKWKAGFRVGDGPSKEDITPWVS